MGDKIKSVDGRIGLESLSFRRTAKPIQQLVVFPNASKKRSRCPAPARWAFFYAPIEGGRLQLGVVRASSV